MYHVYKTRPGLAWNNTNDVFCFFFQLPVKKKTKAVSRKMKKILEFEKQLQEKELVREFYREFWPDNV